MLTKKALTGWPVLLIMVLMSILLVMTSCEKRDPIPPSQPEEEIEETKDVATLLIQSSPQFVQIDTLGVEGTSNIIVIAKSDDNVGIADVKVTLSTDLGFIQGTVRTDSTGAFVTPLNNAGSAGVATVKAWTMTPTDTLQSETSVEFTLPEVPDYENERLNITASPRIIFADENETTSKISVLLTNKNGEPIPERIIYFSTVNSETGDPIGSIPSTAETNESGRDTLTFQDSGDEGVAMIIGRAGTSLENSAKDTVFVTINPVPSDSIASIELTVDDPGIQVKGTGGDETAKYTAHLFDENNNAVPDGKQVTFTIVHAPDSLVYLNDPFMQTITATTSGGIATALLYSGENSGTVSVRATAGSVSATNTRVTIAAGPPRWINVFTESEGDQIGGGIWQIGVGAIVDDKYGNAVPHGTAVLFELLPPEHAAEIYPYAYTGNENAEGDSTEGIAFTHLNYGPDQIFTQVVVKACSDTVCGTRLVNLPFQNPEDGTIILIVIPTVINLGGGQANVQATATLLDGYGAPIAGGTIVFENEVAGQILSNPVVTDENGQAVTLVRFTQDDFPGDADQVTAILRARLLGYDLVSDDVSITVFSGATMFD